MADRLTIIHGDARQKLKELASESVHCCVTSPPYFGLRDYGVDGQLGLERTPDEYVSEMVKVFREVKRVLRPDGTLWLNLGDSYAARIRQSGEEYAGELTRSSKGILTKYTRSLPPGLKEKDLIGVPWRVAFALQADGWYLRSDIIWSKPNPMPESVTDRPTKSHEYIFLLSKAERYYYDAESIREPHTQERDWPTWEERKAGGAAIRRGDPSISGDVCHWAGVGGHPNGRNRRSVWTVTTKPYSGAHFATFPPDLIKPCILAGTSEKGCCSECGSPYKRIVEPTPEYAQHLGKDWSDQGQDNAEGRGHFLMADGSRNTQRPVKRNAPSLTAEYVTKGWKAGCDCKAEVIPCTVLDPFAGSGTTGKVALELGRKAILIELNGKYLDLIERRCATTYGLPLTVEATA